MAESWLQALNGDPLPWLLEDGNPAVRQMALRLLLDRPADDPELLQIPRSSQLTHPATP